MLMKRQKIGIIGAGAVGVTLAYTLEVSGIAREIVLLDKNQQRLIGEVMDLNHGLPFSPRVAINTGDYDDIRDADIVVLTAGAKQKAGESRLDLLKRNVEITRNVLGSLLEKPFDGILLIVSNPVDVLTRLCLEESDLPPGRVLGSGTVLDTARFRFMLSEWLDVDPHNVHAYIVGEHGDSETPLWSSAQVGGMSLELYCQHAGVSFTEAIRESITERVRTSAENIIRAKGVTNYGVSMAVARIIRAILEDERRVLTVSTPTRGQYGLNDVCLGLPTLISAKGVEKALELNLSERELLGLRESASRLQSAYKNTCLR